LGSDLTIAYPPSLSLKRNQAWDSAALDLVDADDVGVVALAALGLVAVLVLPGLAVAPSVVAGDADASPAATAGRPLSSFAMSSLA
jgi:hypothetical protein